MNLDRIVRECGLSGGVVETLLKTEVKEENIDFLTDAYDKGDEVFGEAIATVAKLENITAEELNLYIYILLYVRIYSLYREREIPDNIFFDTVRREIESIAGLCFKELGIYGIQQNKYRRWLRFSLDGRLFALGALSFELRYDSEFEGEVDGVTLKKGDTHVSVHIPRYEKLTEERCEEAYSLAREFFKKHFGLEKIVFLCHSWMLHPWLEEVLPKTSGIIKFSEKYKKIEVEEHLAEVKFWIFPDDENTPIDELPQNTSLQRAFIEKARAGESLGVACGIRT
ncbi:MAG: hypothetical protein IKM21_03630 [Oscillospiraceae bacterium]|nr:hypothetical protein [Oscillospiraceae bacterium]